VFKGLIIVSLLIFFFPPSTDKSAVGFGCCISYFAFLVCRLLSCTLYHVVSCCTVRLWKFL